MKRHPQTFTLFPYTTLFRSEANIGAAMPLRSIAACVIGGGSLRGGTGRLGSVVLAAESARDRERTRLNSSHRTNSYAGLSMKKKKYCQHTQAHGPAEPGGVN